MAREYGIRNPDGTVTVWVDPENGQPHYPVRTESWEVNQGLTGGPSVGGTTDVFDYYNHLLEIQLAQLKEQQRAAMAREALERAQQEYLRQRLEQLEIEQMKRLDERERHRLAVEAAISKADLTGWLTGADLAVLNTVEGGLHALGDYIGGYPLGTMAQETGGIAASIVASAAPAATAQQSIVPTQQLPRQGFGTTQASPQPMGQPMVEPMATPRRQEQVPPFGGWTTQTISKNPLTQLAWG